MKSWLLASTALLVACGGSGEATPDAPSIDAPRAIDGPPPPIVGVWERQPFDHNPNSPAPLIKIAASGQYSDAEFTGTWRLVGDQLDIVHPDGQEEIFDYYLSPDHQTLVTASMLPVGPTAGFVGKWHGKYQVQAGVPVDATMDIHADGTATWTEIRPAGTSAHDGGWTLDATGTSASLGFTLGTTPVNIGMRVIPDVAIGDYLHVRYQ